MLLRRRWTFLAIAALLWSCAAGEASSPQPIIDVHLHAFSYDAYGLPAPQNEVTGHVPHYKSDSAAMRATFDTLRKYNVVRAVASGPVADIRRWRTATSTVIMGGAYAGPRNEVMPLVELEHLVASGEVQVLGELGERPLIVARSFASGSGIRSFSKMCWCVIQPCT